jgi:hypothetical protein
MKRITLAILVLAISAHAQLATLTAPDPSAGASVLLISSGAALGAPLANNGAGAIYFYKTPWQGIQAPAMTLVAADGEAGDRFGQAMATAGSQLIVGAPGANGGSGAVYVYVNLALTQEITLSEPGCGLGESLSTSLANPQWLVVSAPGCGNGMAILYQFTGGQWQLLEEVTQSSPGKLGAVAMGYSNPLGDGPFMAMGMPMPGGNAGTVYVGSVSTGIFPVHGFAWDFGSAISMQQSSNLLFIGEPSTGTVYVFYGPNHEGYPFWQQGGKLVAKLTDSSLGPNSGFGSSISARGKALLIGAPGASVVDLFEQPARMWADSDSPTRRWQGAGGASVAVEVGKLPQFISAGGGTGYVEGVQ